jgi:hypothetical protein
MSSASHGALRPVDNNRSERPGSGVSPFYAALSLLLGLLVGVLALVAVLMCADARDAATSADHAAATSTQQSGAGQGMDMGTTATTGAKRSMSH